MIPLLTFFAIVFSVAIVVGLGLHRFCENAEVLMRLLGQQQRLNKYRQWERISFTIALIAVIGFYFTLLNINIH